MKIFGHYRLGLVLAVIVITMFLVLSVFFLDGNYYKNSIFLNSFVIPPIFVLMSLMGLVYLKKVKGTLSFKKGFTFAYLNQLIGFVISLAFIMIYMNFISLSTRDIFNFQLYDTYYQQAQKEINDNGELDLPTDGSVDQKKQSEEVIKYLKKQRDSKDSNFFSFSNSLFWMVIFLMNFFYLLNSVFLSLFVKTPKPIE